ncbi:MAG TPA: hypothetical protein VER17_04565 [Tepidisphaeraceae bacterium]|nr:hypothetical protein [Tepidisphaeraceae bacterium]
MTLHPQIIRKDGKEQFVVLPYEEFLAIQERLEDAEDVLALRAAKQADTGEPSLSLDDVERRFGAADHQE